MSGGNLIWIDLEMTGLDPDNDQILEIATIVTDSQLNEVAEGPMLAIHHPVEVLEAMGSWCTRHHKDSGLWDRVVKSQVGMRQAEKQTIDFLKRHVEQGASPMCGNTICQDRRFLYRQMPRLESYFHYRHIDVSTIKELAVRWNPDLADGFSKTNQHLALADIRESIEELKYYRQYLGELAGLKP